jgi:hypothetical protein
MTTERPKRIQRKRTKGWKMPENTVYVGRPSRWGNPFTVDWCYVTAKTATEAFRDLMEGYFDPGRFDGIPDDVFRSLCDAKEEWRRRLNWGLEVKQGAITELRGKNLACWCPLARDCHADVLLELANAE